MFTRTGLVLAASCCLASLAPVVTAQQADADEVVRCINISRISNTDVIDDHNIIFHMRGGKIYRNELPRRCPGLRHEKAFMYETSLAQLCDLDVVTVLHDQGFGFTPGPSCGLGSFHPITKDEIKALKKAPARPEPEEPPTAEPEEID